MKNNLNKISNSDNSKKEIEMKEIKEIRKNVEEILNQNNFKEENDFIKNINSIPKNQRKEYLENTYIKLKEDYNYLQNIFDEVELFFENSNQKINPKIFDDLLFEIKNELKFFSKEDRDIILDSVEKYYFQISESYEIYEKYKDNPDDFFKEDKDFMDFIKKNNLHFSFESTEIEIFKWALIIRVKNKENLRTYWRYLANDSSMEVNALWFATLNHASWKDLIFSYKWWWNLVKENEIIVHEQRHIRNHIIMLNRFENVTKKLDESFENENTPYEILHKNILDYCSILLQDELVAQIRWNSEKIEELDLYLKYEYNYLNNFDKEKIPNYKELKRKYDILTKNTLETFKKLLLEWIELDMLMAMPVSKWKNLSKIKHFQKTISESENEKNFKNWKSENWIFNSKWNLVKWTRFDKNDKTFLENWDFENWILKNWVRISKLKKLQIIKDNQILDNIFWRFEINNYDKSSSELKFSWILNYKDMELYCDIIIKDWKFFVSDWFFYKEKNGEKVAIEIKDWKILEEDRDFKIFYNKNKDINNILEKNIKKDLRNKKLNKFLFNNLVKLYKIKNYF